MGYEIKVLGSDEFDRLPYEGIADSLGFADVKHGRVYVRHTGSHELNRYLINHEIDHLVEQHATDEDAHGIRHKKAKNFFRSFFNPLNVPGMGPLSNSKKGVFNTDNQSSLQAEGLSQEPGQSEQPQVQFPQQQTAQSPLGQFNQASVPSSFEGSNTNGPLASGLGNRGLNTPNQQLSPEMIERIKGFYSGRISF